MTRHRRLSILATRTWRPMTEQYFARQRAREMAERAEIERDNDDNYEEPRRMPGCLRTLFIEADRRDQS